MFIMQKKSTLWICKTSTDTDTHTAQNLTAFHQADDAFDNYIFLIAFIESIDRYFSKLKTTFSNTSTPTTFKNNLVFLVLDI